MSHKVTIDQIVENVENATKHDNLNFDIYEPNLKPGTPTIINNGWDDMKTYKLKEWIEENKIYNWLLKSTSEHFRFLESIITIPMIVFTLIGVTLSFLATAINNKNTNPECDNINIYIIMSIVVQMFGSILVLIKTFYGLSKIITGCNIMSRKFAALTTDLDEILTERIDERTNGTTYIREKSKERKDLLVNLPEIPQRIWKKFNIALLNGSINDIDTSVFMRRRHSNIPTSSIPINIPTIQTPTIEETAFTIPEETDKKQEKIERLKQLSSQIQWNLNRY